MPTKFEREIDEIIQKTGGPRHRRRPGDLTRGITLSFIRARSALTRISPFAINPSSVMLFAFAILIAGLVCRPFNNVAGSATSLTGVGLFVIAYALYLFRPASRKQTGRRGSNLNRRR